MDSSWQLFGRAPKAAFSGDAAQRGEKRDRVKALVAEQSYFAIVILFLTFYLCIERPMRQSCLQ